MDLKEKLKDFKLYTFEWGVYVKAEDYKKIAIENKKLKSDVEDMDKALLQHINAVSELQEKIKKLNEENKKLKEENEELKEYKSMYEWLCK